MPHWQRTSATPRPAFSISVSPVMPYSSIASRSTSRACSRVKVCIVQILRCHAHDCRGHAERSHNPHAHDKRGHGTQHCAEQPPALTPGPASPQRERGDSLISLHRHFFQAPKHHRAEQAGRLQGRIFPPMMPRGERLPRLDGPRLVLHQPVGPFLQNDAVPLDVFRLLLIADEPIRPQVRHAHFQLILARLRGFRDIDPERRFPRDAAILAVEPHLGNLANAGRDPRAACDSRPTRIAEC